MSDYKSLLAGASQLPLDIRVQLIDALWDTVPEDSLPDLSDNWIAEIERRSAEYTEGTVQVIPWEQVRNDARRRAGFTVSKSFQFSQ
jgi:putative addiction module component (TIGR02574 family)